MCPAASKLIREDSSMSAGSMLIREDSSVSYCFQVD